MLETVDLLIKTIIANHYGYATNDIIYAPEAYALRARNELLTQPNTVLPFVSFYRMDCKKDNERYRKGLVANNGVVVGYNAGETKYIWRKIVPITARYDIVFWEKDNLRINSIIRTHAFKTGRITAVSFQYANGDVKLDCDVGDLDYANRVPNFQEFLFKNLIYNASFSFEVKNYIVSDPTLMGIIKKVIVSFGMSADDPEKEVFELDVNT